MAFMALLQYEARALPCPPRADFGSRSSSVSFFSS
jgi:hypothetical protein